MTEKEKEAISSVITALKDAKKTIKSVAKPSARTKEAGEAINAIIKMLSDKGPGPC